MTTRLASTLACAVALSLTGCIDDATDSDRQESDNTPGCSNTTDNNTEPCPCVDDSDCPDAFHCQITDSALPPFNGVCLPDPAGCENNTDPNCVPDPGCNAGDPNCPPDNGGGCNAGDPNCVPPDNGGGCNAGDPNCP